MLSCWYLLLFGLLYYLWYHIYAFSLLFCKVYLKRENSGSWNSGLEKEQILVHYSAHLQMTWKVTWIFLGLYKKYWAKEVPEGSYQGPTSLVAATPWWRLHGLWAPWRPTSPPLLLYEGFRSRKKINRELFRGFTAATRRNLSRSNLELRQDDPAGETSLPEGEIVAIVQTNTPLVGGEASSSTSSSAPSPLQSLVHLL